jgi:hypothetical protein
MSEDIGVHVYEGLSAFGCCAVCLGRGKLDPIHRAVHLQNYGTCPAKQACDLEPGDVIVYNFGSTATVVSVEPVGLKSVSVQVRDAKGRDSVSRKLITTLVGFSQKLTDKAKESAQ